MKKLLLTLAAAAMSASSTFAALYTIEFKSNSSDNSRDLTEETYAAEIEKGAEYVSGIENCSKVYAGKNGLKFSSSKVNGTITFNLANPISNVTSVAVKGMNWKAGQSSSLNIKLTADAEGVTNALSDELAKYVYALTGEVKSLILSAEGRCYVKSITICTDGDVLPDDPVIDPITPEDGDGTAEHPYSVAKTIELSSALDADTKIENVYVKGFITSIKEVSTGFGNASYYIGDTKDSATSFYIFRGYWLNGEKFTSEDQIKEGAEVVVLGSLMNYMGNTPEMAQGNQIVSYKDNGGTTPVDPVEYDTYIKASNIVSGSKYVFAIGEQIGTAISKSASFGRFALKDATFSGDKLESEAVNAVTFIDADGKYTMVDSYGRYLGMDDSHFTSFQLYDAPTDGCYWTVTFEANGVRIVNNLNTDCVVAQSKGAEGTFYTNVAPANVSAVAPEDYNLPSLYVYYSAGTGVENINADANAPVEYYNLQGVRVANPENGLYIRRQGNKATKVLVK